MPKKSSKPMTQAVADAHAESQPESYASRYTYDFDTNSIIPRATASNEAFRLTSGNNDFGVNPHHLIGGTASCHIGDSESDDQPLCDWRGLRHTETKEDMRKAFLYWRRDPLVARCVKVLTQLSNSRMMLSCENEEFKQLVENWLAKAMPHSFRKAWFTEYFRMSMVPTIKTLIPYKPRDYRTNKTPAGPDAPEMTKADATMTLVDQNEAAMREFSEAFAKWNHAADMHAKGLCSEARLEKFRQVMAVTQAAWISGHIAGSYTVLDPLTIDIEGPKEMPWLRQPYLNVSGELQQAISRPTAQQKEMVATLPAEIVQQLRAGSQKIWLSPSVCSIVYGEKQPHERYPTPMVIHAEKALEMKHLLMEMDKATATKLRDRILKVTIGNDTFPASDPQQLLTLRQVFNAPTRTLTIFWDHTLEIEWVEPQNITFNDTGKYDVWNNEIRTVFGISAVVTGTSDKTGSIGNSMMNFKGIKEEVEEAQAAFLEWLYGEINMLRQALGVRWEIKITHDRLNLEDEVQFTTLLMQLVQNGIIDHQTAIEVIGYHFPTIEKRMQAIKKLQKNGKGIFLAQPSSNNLGPNAGGLPTGGRPAKKPSSVKPNQQKKGKSQPKKKAKAKLLPADDGIKSYLVVQAEQLPVDDRQVAADQFQIPVEWVVTEAEYTQATGKQVDWTPLLPKLSMQENLKAMASTNQDMAAIAVLAEQDVEAKKQAGTIKYATKKLVGQCIAERVVAALSSMKPEQVDATEWVNRLNNMLQGMTSEGSPTDEQRVLAANILKLQYAKMLPRQ